MFSQREIPFSSQDVNHIEVGLTKYAEPRWPEEPQRGGGKFFGVLEYSLAVCWHNTHMPEPISSHSTQDCNKIISSHLASPRLIFYFWLSGLMMMEILCTYQFSERNDYKVSLTEKMTDIPGQLPNSIVCVTNK